MTALFPLDPPAGWHRLPWTAFREEAASRPGLAVLPVAGLKSDGGGDSLYRGQRLLLGDLEVSLRGDAAPGGARVLPVFDRVPRLERGQAFCLDEPVARAALLEWARSAGSGCGGRIAFLHRDRESGDWLATVARSLRIGDGFEAFVIDAGSCSDSRAGGAPSLPDLLREILRFPRDAPGGADAPEAFSSREASSGPPTVGRFPGKPGRGGGKIALLAVGAIEQHGPHLPVGVDALLGSALLRACLEDGDAPEDLWPVPPIWVGKSDEHHDFPGTVWISADSLREQVLSVARQLAEWGVGRLAILNTHGGNGPVLRTTAREIEAAGLLRVRVLAMDAPGEFGAGEARNDIHGGRHETALMEYLAPGLVDRRVADRCWMEDRMPGGALRAENAPATFAWKTSDLSASGTLGDATRANPADGRRWFGARVAALVGQLRGFAGP